MLAFCVGSWLLLTADVTVYVPQPNEEGLYHTIGCSGGSPNKKPVTITEATEQKLRPHDFCNPPSPPKPKPASVAPATDGPFGLTAGMSREALEAITGEKISKEGDSYHAKKVPKSHRGFEHFALHFGPEGLCAIRAIGVEIPTSAHGVELRRAFDAMEETLASVYGKHDRTDFLRSGSIWHEPQEWMMALLKKERVLMSRWSEDYGSDLKNRVQFVGVMAFAVTQSTGRLGLNYEFDNWDSCKAVADDKEKSVF